MTCSNNCIMRKELSIHDSIRKYLPIYRYSLRSLGLDSLEANIKEMSRLAAEAGLLLRPHIKVHQSAFIARLQVEAGACSIEAGTIDQAEVFAAEGFDDILVVHPFYGQPKLPSGA